MIALDIETACNVLSCEEKQCKHALDPFKNRITCIGTWDGTSGYVFRSIAELDLYLSTLNYPELVGHNLKFDLRNLFFHGLDLRDCYAHDTQLLGSLTFDKVPEHYLSEYELQRSVENEKLPKGYSHRQAGALSLKVMAPYYLGVKAFWENPVNHDDDEYVLKDCRYTFLLAQYLMSKMDDRVLEFYNEWLMPKVRMLLDMEIKGITIDLEELDRQDMAAREDRGYAKRALDELWAKPMEHYHAEQIREVCENYRQKAEVAVQRLKMPKLKDQNKALERYQSKIQKAQKRYADLENKAIGVIEPFNIDSPKQLSWLLKDYYNLDIENFEGEESTGRSVLNRLANEGREDIKKFLEYRKLNKLVTSFFPTYRDLHKDGIIHCTFNPTGTRTGRLSSQEPNLQQVPGHLHKLFVARPGYKLASFDQASIEAKLIAYVTEDKTLNEVLNSGKNFHSVNTKVFFDLKCPWQEVKENYAVHREASKNCIFALFYGAMARRIQETFLTKGFDWSPKRCRKALDNIRGMYPDVWTFKERLDKQIAVGPIFNMFGRPICIPNHDEIYMKGFNSYIQGAASDLVLDSAMRIAQHEFLTPLLLVHDAIIVEYPEEREQESIELIKHCMTDYHLENRHGKIKLEVEGNVAKHWAK